MTVLALIPKRLDAPGQKYVGCTHEGQLTGTQRSYVGYSVKKEAAQPLIQTIMNR